MKKMKKLLSCILAIVMAVSVLPLQLAVSAASFEISNGAAYKLEAEDYTSIVGGKILQDPAASGGKYIGDFYEGNEISFGLNVAQAGTYKLVFSVGTPNDCTASVKVNGAEVGTFAIAKTGEWQNYAAYELEVELAEGEQTISLKNTGGTFNVDYALLIPDGLSVSHEKSLKLEAENYVDQDGTKVLFNNSNASGGAYVGDYHEGDMLAYGFDVEEAGRYRITLTVGSENDGACDVVIGGNTYGCSFAATGAWQTYHVMSVAAELEEGYNYMELLNTFSVWNLDYIEIEYIGEAGSYTLKKDEPLTIEAETWITSSGIVNESSTASGGMNVGNVDDGDYFTYDLNVEEKGIYLATLRVACGNEVGAPDGVRIISENMGYSTASVPVTGGWQEYIEVTLPVRLMAGEQTLTFWADYEGWNFDYFTLSYMDELSNAATSGVAFASSDADGAAYLNDSTTTSSDESWSAAAGEYAGVRFETEYAINKAVIYGSGIEGGRILFSDGTYIDVPAVTMDGTTVEFETKDIYWARFETGEAGEGAYITELELHGDPVPDAAEDLAFDAFLNTGDGYKKGADTFGGVTSADNSISISFNGGMSIDTLIFTGVPETAGDTLNGTLELYSGASYDVSVPVTGEARMASITFDKALIDEEFKFTAELTEGAFSFDSLAIFGDGASALPAADKFENVEISCRWKGDEVFSVDDSGKLIYVSTNGEYDEQRTRWNVQKVGDTDYYTIQNAATGGYLALEGDVNTVSCIENGDELDAGKWTLGNVSGYKRITNAVYTTRTLHVEQQDGVIYAEDVPTTYHSANWSFNPAERSYEILPNRVIDTGKRAIANDGNSITSNDGGSDSTWTLSRDISGSPSFSAPNMPIVEAIYNRTMEETYENMYESTYGTVFRTGTNWNKVWTRDTAMAVQYSLAWIYPVESRNCALEKIVGEEGSLTYEEDTGTGGSYPVSTDRIITTLSVWEQYLTTGDTDFLAQFYEYTENTINQDLHVAYDKETGLFLGETGGLDHREKTYPDWMANWAEESLPNIAESKSSIVNIIYCAVYDIMARAAGILGYGDDVVTKWETYRDGLRARVNEHFWDEEMGLYVSWEYPNYMGAPKAFKYDVISNGYAVMYGVADEEQSQAIMENYPLVLYGADTVFPQKNGAQASVIYHNRGVWPGWEGTLMIGAAQEGNNQLSDEIWRSCLRGVAMTLTNKEVIDFTTGAGVASNNQLWSIGATLAGYYRVLFGMEYTEQGIVFKPFVADWLVGPFELTNYEYRNADLTLKLYGTGDTLTSIKLDGVEMGTDYILPTDLEGEHTIELTVEDSGNRSEINLSDYNHVTCPDLPEMTYEDGVLTWEEDSRYTYKLWNGEQYIDVSGGSYVPPTDRYGVYSIVAVAEDGIVSEMSRPIIINAEENVITVEAEDGVYNDGTFSTEISGYTGTGYVNDFMGNNTPVTITVDIEKAGKYYFSAVYNNRGDSTSGNYCGIRSVYVDGEDVGTMMFPVMDFNYQTSTHLALELSEGEHTITLVYDDANWYDRNMAKTTNNVGYDSFTLEYVGSNSSSTATAPETVVKNEKFQITAVTDRDPSSISIANENGGKVTSKIVSVSTNNDGTSTVIFELSVGTAGESRTLRLMSDGSEIASVTFDVVKYITGIDSVDVPESVIRYDTFEAVAVTTDDLIKGKFVNEYDAKIGAAVVSRVRENDRFTTVYELSVGTPGENRQFTFKADFDKCNDFPYSFPFELTVIDF